LTDLRMCKTDGRIGRAIAYIPFTRRVTR